MKDYIATLNKSLLQLVIDVQAGKTRLLWGYAESTDADGNTGNYVLALTQYYGIVIAQHECYITLPAGDYKETGIKKYFPAETGKYFGDISMRVNTNIIVKEKGTGGRIQQLLPYSDDIGIDTSILKIFGKLSNLSIYASTSPYMFEVYYGGTLIGIVMGVKRRKVAQDQ